MCHWVVYFRLSRQTSRCTRFNSVLRSWFYIIAQSPWQCFRWRHHRRFWPRLRKPKTPWQRVASWHVICCASVHFLFLSESPWQRSWRRERGRGLGVRHVSVISVVFPPVIHGRHFWRKNTQESMNHSFKMQWQLWVNMFVKFDVQEAFQQDGHRPLTCFSGHHQVLLRGWGVVSNKQV